MQVRLLMQSKTQIFESIKSQRQFLKFHTTSHSFLCQSCTYYVYDKKLVNCRWVTWQFIQYAWMLFLLACLRLLTTFNKCGNLFLFSVLHLIFSKGKSFTNSVNDLCFQVWNFWSEQFWTVLYQLRKWKASAAVYTGNLYICLTCISDENLNVYLISTKLLFIIIIFIITTLWFW